MTTQLTDHHHHHYQHDNDGCVKGRDAPSWLLIHSTLTTEFYSGCSMRYLIIATKFWWKKEYLYNPSCILSELQELTLDNTITWSSGWFIRIDLGYHFFVRHSVLWDFRITLTMMTINRKSCEWRNKKTLSLSFPFLVFPQSFSRIEEKREREMVIFLRLHHPMEDIMIII